MNHAGNKLLFLWQLEFFSNANGPVGDNLFVRDWSIIVSNLTHFMALKGSKLGNIYKNFTDSNFKLSTDSILYIRFPTVLAEV